MWNYPIVESSHQKDIVYMWSKSYKSHEGKRALLISEKEGIQKQSFVL